MMTAGFYLWRLILIKGVLYIAFGDKARYEANASVTTLLRQNDLPIRVISDGVLERFPDLDYQTMEDPGPGARWAKVSMNDLVPDDWEAFLFLDADTRVMTDLAFGFGLLERGWDMAIAPSCARAQYPNGFVRLPQEDKALTNAAMGGLMNATQLNTGVIFAHRESCRHFFETWKEEWNRTKVSRDQGAFLRALYRVPLSVWLLSLTWNGGPLIHHKFGKCREGENNG